MTLRAPRVVGKAPFFGDLDTGLAVALAGDQGTEYGEHAALAARLLPRFEVMFDHVDLDSALATADLVITAEGTIDDQTPRGKIPAEVARRAKRHGKAVIALAGTIGATARVNYDVGIDAYAGILPAPVDFDHALRHGAEYLTDATERALRLILVGAALAAA